MNPIASLPTADLRILREALADYVCHLRTDPATQVVQGHNEFISRDDLSPIRRETYLQACGMLATVKAALARRP